MPGISSPGKLILVRHGQSIWNVENLFTGWHDVDLSDQGRIEARSAGVEIKKAGLMPDIAFTSVLKRAIRTLWSVLDEMDLMWLPVERSWRLNERHYGALQGLDKAQTVAKHGEAQVKIWRRSYDIRPPALTLDDPRFPGHDPRYRGLSRENEQRQYAGQASANPENADIRARQERVDQDAVDIQRAERTQGRQNEW